MRTLQTTLFQADPHPASRLPPLLLTAIWLASTCGALAGQIPTELVEQALDQRIERLELPSAPLPEALGTLEQRTGLRFRLDPAALERMPYGAQTHVAIAIQDMSVREALRRIFDGLGLEMQVVEDRVAVRSIPVVERLGRRLTVAEMALLERMASKPWSSTGPDAVPVEIRIDPQWGPRDRFEQALAQTRAHSAMRQLDAATSTLGWVWFPEDTRVVLTTRAEDVRRRLDMPIDLSCQRRPLEDVLTDIGQRIGVTVMFEPGVLRRVDARERAVDLVQRQAPARQVLERICGNTGLKYDVTDDGLRFAAGEALIAQPSLTPPRGGPATGEPWVRIEIEVEPGVRMVTFLAVEQLPDDMRQRCLERLQALLEER
jgi:hypothetical protein